MAKLLGHWDFSKVEPDNIFKNLTGNTYYDMILYGQLTSVSAEGRYFTKSPGYYMNYFKDKKTKIIQARMPFYVDINCAPKKPQPNDYKRLTLFSTRYVGSGATNGDSTGIELVIEYDGNVVFWDGYYNKYVETTTKPIIFDQSNNIILSDGAIQGSKTELYVNGKLVSTRTRSSDLTTVGVFINSRFTVGAVEWGVQPFEGYIKDMKIYEGVYSPYVQLLSYDNRLFYIDTDSNFVECGDVDDPNLLETFKKYGMTDMPTIVNNIPKWSMNRFKIITLQRG